MAATRLKHRRRSKGHYINFSGLAQTIQNVENKYIQKRPEFRAGDTVRIHVRIKEGEKERIQMYEGVIIALSNTGIGRSFTVRKISHGVGVERIFLLSSPKVAKIEVVQRGRVRRAKLYYLRDRQGKAARVARDVVATAALRSAEKAAAGKQPTAKA